MNAVQRQKLADQIRAAVRNSGMSQNAVADRAGIDRGALSKFMTGERGVSMEALEALGVALDLEIRATKRPKKKKS